MLRVYGQGRWRRSLGQVSAGYEPCGLIHNSPSLTLRSPGKLSLCESTTQHQHCRNVVCWVHHDWRQKNSSSDHRLARSPAIQPSGHLRARRDFLLAVRRAPSTSIFSSQPTRIFSSLPRWQSWPSAPSQAQPCILFKTLQRERACHPYALGK